MNGKAVGERREARRQAQFRSDDGAAFVAGDAERAQILTRDAAGVRGGAREGETDAVEHGALAKVCDIGGNVLRTRADREVRDVRGERFVGLACGGVVSL